MHYSSFTEHFAMYAIMDNLEIDRNRKNNSLLWDESHDSESESVSNATDSELIRAKKN